MNMKNIHDKKSATLAVPTVALGLFASGAIHAADPYAKPDDSWLSVSGTVTSVAPDSFMLDYGKGLITVEFDDGDMDADAYKLLSGDKVTVYGYVDDDLYETRTIEAGSVYVEGLNTYFYASANDEEGPAEDSVYTTWVAATPIVVGSYDLTGTVSGVSGRELTLDTGVSQVSVDTMGMAYNPMDDEGYQKIEEGDRVRVYGDLDVSLFDETEIAATTILTLKDASRETEE